MKQEDMVVGREYLHANRGEHRYTYLLSVGPTRGPLSGNFESSKEPLVSHCFRYSKMTEAPQAPQSPESKPEFKIDDEIEVSSRADFKINKPTRGKFKYLDPDGDYWIAKNSNGLMFYGKFARKVAPMVKISEFGEFDYWEITQAHMDKIKAGDFNV
tara:strand:- start:24 stop:494 length:471 start_codon:yes stop_codon:yes gene_type:complete